MNSRKAEKFFRDQNNHFKKRFIVVGFLEVLTIVFIVLKLTEVIAWSWWAVFSPILIGYAAIFLLTAGFYAISALTRDKP